MASLATTARRREEEEEPSNGGPISALVIAVPVSLAIWGALFFVIFNLIH